MKQFWQYTLAAGLGALVGAGLVLFWPRDNAFEQAAQHAEMVADSAIAVADSAVQAADSAEARAARAEARASQRDTVTRTVVDSILAEPAADTAERRAWVQVVDSLTASNRDLRTAFAEQQRAAAALRIAVDTLTTAVQAADSALALRPGIPRWGVSVSVGITAGPGVFAGLCATGKPCAGAGGTINVGVGLHIGRK